MKRPRPITVRLARIALGILEAPRKALVVGLAAFIVAALGWAALARPAPYGGPVGPIAVGGGRFASRVFYQFDRIAVFEPDGSDWVPQVLRAPQQGPKVDFGNSLALSARYLAVSVFSRDPSVCADVRCPLRGAEEIHVYRRRDECRPRNRDCWERDATMVDHEPKTLSIWSQLAADGERIAVLSSLPGPDSELRIYRREQEGWKLEHRERDRGGTAAPALHGGRLVAVLPAPTVFELGPGGWSRVAELAPPEPLTRRYVDALDISADRAVVSWAYGGVHVFARGPSGQWAWEVKLEPDEALRAELEASVPVGQGCHVSWGHGVALDGDRVVVSVERLGCRRNGAASVSFERRDAVWQQIGVLEFPWELWGINMYMPFAADDQVLVLGSYHVAVARRPSGPGENYGDLQIPSDPSMIR